MLDNRIPRIALTVVLALGTMGVAVLADAPSAGATGVVGTSISIKVNGGKTTAVTTSPTSTVAVYGLPAGATGTVEIDQAGGPLCTAVLPARSCTTSTLAPGSYPGITGTYSGDGTYAGSTSTNSVTLTVLSGGGLSTTCSKMSGYVTKKITFSYCQVSQKGAHLSGVDILTGGSLTWNASKTTTTFTGSATSPGQGVCTAGHIEEIFTGTVTTDTSSFAAAGGAVSYSFCQSTRGVVKLVPGTQATF